MFARRVLGVLCCALAVPSSAGASNPVCELLVDPVGDHRAIVAEPQPTRNDRTIDIVSADIATDADTVEIAIRFVDLARPTPDFRRDEFYFSVGGQRFEFLYKVWVDGESATFSHYIANDIDVVPDVLRLQMPERRLLATPAYTLDVVNNEIRMSAPLAALASVVPVPPGTSIGSFSIQSARSNEMIFYGVDDVLSDSTTTYAAGTPSCLH